MCGLCLPHCPTYRVGRTEAESPRGRIALARALAAGSTAPSPDVLGHLDQCLSCLSCQTACPSQVRYEDILVATRAARPPARRLPALRWLSRRPALLRSLARAGRGLQVQRWAPRLFGRNTATGRMAAELPRVPPLPQFAARHAAEARGRVGLFAGCVASAFDRDTHAAARHLLEALGYEVVVPASAGCCGALARHAGDLAAAQTDALPTRASFVEAGVDTVITTASGCHGDLRDHALAGTGILVRDIAEFLAADASFSTLRFRPLAHRAALHIPCSVANVTRSARQIAAILQRIPGLEVQPLPDQPRCCGAAGSYFLDHPHIADALRAERTEQIGAAAPDLVLTANVGCRLFLDNALRRHAASPRVVHPVTLLAEQLE